MDDDLQEFECYVGATVTRVAYVQAKTIEEATKKFDAKEWDSIEDVSEENVARITDVKQCDY